MNNQPTCGQALVGLLEDYGIEIAFGVPGVHTLELYRGLAGRKMRHVLVRHEQGASFMADGYARASGRPAACFIITGPGLTNCATGIGQAYSDSVPMVVVTTCNARRDLRKGLGRLHETQDQRVIAEPITAFSERALDAADVPELVARAYGVFEGSRPRPCHIEIPIDVMAAPAEGDWQRRAVPGRPRAASDAIAQAAALLAQAERPLLLIGGGAKHAAEPVRALVEQLDLATVSSYAGKGILPESHPLNLGAALGAPAVQDHLASCDVVLAVGTELAETDSWVEALTINGKLIRIDIDPRKLTDFYPAAVPIQADSATALADLAAAVAALEPAGVKRPDQPALLETLRGAAGASAGPLEDQHRAVLSALRAVLPADALVYTDMTQIAYAGNSLFPVEQPGCWQHPFGYGTLGYALPAAIGGKLGAPERTVISLSGDGGFLYTVQEMATAAELKLPIVQILWNNDALAQIRDGMAERDIELVGVIPENPDFLAMARSYHWQAHRAESLADLQRLVTEAAAGNGPTLIEVREGEGDWAA